MNTKRPGVLSNGTLPLARSAAFRTLKRCKNSLVSATLKRSPSCQNSAWIMQPILEEFSGSKYRFEEMPLAFRDDGKLDFAILPAYLDEYRRAKFSR